MKQNQACVVYCWNTRKNLVLGKILMQRKDREIFTMKTNATLEVRASIVDHRMTRNSEILKIGKRVDMIAGKPILKKRRTSEIEGNAKQTKKMTWCNDLFLG